MPLPVADNLPGGESWALTNQSWVILSCSPKQLVCTHVTLIPPSGKVPIGQSKGLIASESLKAKGRPSFCLSIRCNKKACKQRLVCIFTKFVARLRVLDREMSKETVVLIYNTYGEHYIFTMQYHSALIKKEVLPFAII
jgi:hypothetical protein